VAGVGDKGEGAGEEATDQFHAHETAGQQRREDDARLAAVVSMTMTVMIVRMGMAGPVGMAMPAVVIVLGVSVRRSVVVSHGFP